jgi:GTP-binding protein Era
MTRSGFVAVLGRPNVGKSTLVNRLVGQKVSIVSFHPGTTRMAVRGILTRGDDQLILVDTPGMQKPSRLAGRAMNAAAISAASDVDLAVVVIDGRRPVGARDLEVLALVAQLPFLVVLNKADQAGPTQILANIDKLSSLGLAGRSQWPISARTGLGVDALVEEIVSHLPEGPHWYPPGMTSDLDEHQWVAELVREQLLIHLREEMPHSVACRVTEWGQSRITCQILVERESQKGIVIGAGGSVLSEVGHWVRKQLPAGVYLELQVRVEPRWPDRTDWIQQLGIGSG